MTHNETQGAEKMKKRASKKGALHALASKMFEPIEKEPYYLEGKAFGNLAELNDNLGDFTEREAEWLAAWLKYLGDAKTASRIRKRPGEFSRIISARHAELEKHWEK